jgi:hypothetical protein
MRIASCSSPRPKTLKTSEAVGLLQAEADVAHHLALEALADLATREELAVLPANGLVLCENATPIVGSSTGCGAAGRGRRRPSAVADRDVLDAGDATTSPGWASSPRAGAGPSRCR